MSQYVESRTKSFIASGAIAINTLVKLASAGVVSTAGLTEIPIGVACETVASGKPVSITLLNSQGTIKMIAAGGISIGALVYGQANGKIDDDSSSSSVLVGRAIEAASYDGDTIEVIPFVRQS